MLYYKYVDMEGVRSNVRELLENIFLILHEKWHYDEMEETQKMRKMFDNPEEILSEIMSIKEIDVRSKKSLSLLDLTEEEKSSAMLENPEEWVADMEDGEESILGIWEDIDLSTERNFEKVKVLAKFLLKMAVYRFCMVHYPKIIKEFGQQLSEDIGRALEYEMDAWEQEFWIYGTTVDFRGYNGSIADGRSLLRYEYSKPTMQRDSSEERDIWNKCIVRAFKDIDTVESVKKMRQDCIGEKQSGRREKDNKSYEENVLVEIRHMKHLLDIMEKNIQGKLTEQDIIELKENAGSWNKDIEKLEEMISSLHN